jgi:probable rRNA maturation factor
LIQIELCNEQDVLAVDESRLRQAVEFVLRRAGVERAVISLAVIDDPAMHRLNRRYLDHDEPTDVLSFVLEEGESYVEGEIVASAETAAATAAKLGWAAEDELLLYVIHGALHLVGYDDLDPEARAEMRAQERLCLSEFGLTPPWAEEAP